MQYTSKHTRHTKYMTSFCWPIVLLLLLAACERTIELGHIQLEPQLVISGVVSPGDTASLQIQSRKYLYAGLPFAEGESYRLEVSAKGYPTATAQLAIPHKPVFSI